MNIFSRNNFRKLIVFFICLTTISTVFANDQDSDKETMVNMPKFPPVVLKFVAFDPSRVLIDETAVVTGIASELVKATSIPLTVILQDGPRTDTAGLRFRVDKLKSEINFQYVKVRNVRSTGAVDLGQVLSIPVGYKIEREKDNIVITLTPPEKAILNDKIRFITSLFMTSEITETLKVGPPDRYFDDFEKVIKSAPAVKLNKFTLASGEAMSKFKPESSLANFERLLGRVRSGKSEYDLKKDNVFSYLSGQNRISLKVSVFPYRDGTKLIYEASLPYQIGADGSSDGFDGPQKLKEAVEKILND